MNSEQRQRLEPAVVAMIEATNTEDREALITAFADDATLIDFGRSFVGREEIAGWSDQENIGTHNRISVTSVEESGATTILGIEVAGDGYNGPGTLAFDVSDGRIARLVISG